MSKVNVEIKTPDFYQTGALLRLDPRDVAGLTWVRDRSRFWQHV